jgi:hypothetical protein
MRPISKSDVEMKSGAALLNLLGIHSTLETAIEPAPDLLFSYQGKKVGVEHTRLFSDDGSSASSFQAYEYNIDTVAETCRVEYLRRGLPPVEVKLFMPQARLSKKGIPILARWIVEAVERFLPENPGQAEIRNDWSGNFPEEIECIRMIRFKGQTSTSFFTLRSAWLRTVEKGWLQTKVDEKASRLPGYLSACDEVWLLMAEEQSGLSNTLEIPDAIWREPFEHHGFARIFVLRRMTELHRLNGLG